MSNLPPPRLVIASNTSTGTSIISSSSTLTPFYPFGPNATGFTTLFSTTSFPASNTAPLPSSTTESIPRPGDKGTVFCTSDIPPFTTSAFHRTRTLDYMVVLKGEIVLRVNGGVEVTVGEGEMCVQRGTIHSISQTLYLLSQMDQQNRSMVQNVMRNARRGTSHRRRR